MKTSISGVLGYITLGCAVIGLLFALLTAKKVLKYDEGTDTMKKISAAIKKGANAYLKRQYTVVSIFFAVMFVVLCVMAYFKFLTWFVPFAFVSGGSTIISTLVAAIMYKEPLTIKSVSGVILGIAALGIIKIF